MERPFDLISFDFDGVILHNTFNEYYLDTLQTLGARWKSGNELTLFRFFHDYWANDLSRQDREAYKENDYWQAINRRFLEKLEIEGDVDAVLLGLADVFRNAPNAVSYFHETVLEETLQRLKDEGYRVVMITNRGASVADLLEEWELAGYFEMIVDRDTAGAPKPNAAPFRYVNDKLDIPPDRCLHIGDSPFSDIMGATNAEWQPLLIDPDGLFPDWDVARIRSLGELFEWMGEFKQQNVERSS